MRHFKIVSIGVVCVLLTVSSTPATEEGRWVASEVVTSYVSGTSPTLILGLDNNLEICLALREPRTISELRSSGVEVTDSQRVLLQLWGLIERGDGGTMRCTVPIIESPATGELEQLAGSVTDELLGALSADVEAYVEMLREAGWGRSSYALLGSFVLDGLVWEALERLEAIESADPSSMPSGSEHWTGVTWITLPPQTHKLGTNSHRTDDGTFCTTWTPSSLDAQRALNEPGLREELAAMASGRLPVPGSHEESLTQLGLIDDDELVVPVVQAGGRTCMESGTLALRFAEMLLRSEPLRKMRQLIAAEDPSVAWIMAYHWVYPRLMSELEVRGLERPAALSGTAGAPLAPTVYVVDPEARCVTTSD